MTRIKDFFRFRLFDLTCSLALMLVGVIPIVVFLKEILGLKDLNLGLMQKIVLVAKTTSDNNFAINHDFVFNHSAYIGAVPIILLLVAFCSFSTYYAILIIRTKN